MRRPTRELSRRRDRIFRRPMATLQYLRALRNKLLGLAHTTQRLDGLELSLRELSSELVESTAQLRMLTDQSAKFSDLLRAANDRCAHTEEQIVKVHADVSRLPSTHDAALGLLRDNMNADINALFGRHANLFRARAPRADIGRPNSGSTIDRIAFLVHSEELLNHYGCVWDLMPEGSFDVLLHGAAAQSLTANLTRWKCGVATTRTLLDSGQHYRYMVSNHPVSDDGEPLIKRLAASNIRFMYAAGKSRWNLSSWNQLYDVIMCFGPYHAINFSHACDATIVQMGYPRFDRYFNDIVDRESLARSQGCDPAKPTVVWLPTQGALSSLGHFDTEIAALMDRYNVVVKVHPLTPLAEPDRIAALNRLGLTRVIVDSEDNLPLYQLADYMLFDYGGPPLAGIYADKRMVLLNVPGASDDTLTGNDSPDVTIRKQLVNVNSHDKALAGLLENESAWMVQQHARRTLRSLYFAPHYGFSSHIAAKTLLNLDKLVSTGV